MTDLCLTDIAGRVLAHDLIRYLAGAGGVYLLINLALARQLAGRRIRAVRPGWRQMRREFVVSLRTVLIFAANGTAISWGAVTGFLPVYDQVAAGPFGDGPGQGWPWLALSTLMVILAHDTWFYWLHRLLHHRAVFRHAHGLHHRSHNPTPFTSYAFDGIEAAGHAIFLPLFVAVVPMHPLALLIFAVHMMLRNAIGHCGYELFPAGADGRPLIGWMTTVTHHDLHHAHGQYNFGLYFTWWDRWMGTEWPEYERAFRQAAGRADGVTARAISDGSTPPQHF